MAGEASRWRQLLDKIAASERPYLSDIDEVAAEVERIEADRDTYEKNCTVALERMEAAEAALAEWGHADCCGCYRKGSTTYPNGYRDPRCSPVTAED